MTTVYSKEITIKFEDWDNINNLFILSKRNIWDYFEISTKIIPNKTIVKVKGDKTFIFELLRFMRIEY